MHALLHFTCGVLCENTALGTPMQGNFVRERCAVICSIIYAYMLHMQFAVIQFPEFLITKSQTRHRQQITSVWRSITRKWTMFYISCAYVHTYWHIDSNEEYNNKLKKKYCKIEQLFNVKLHIRFKSVKNWQS